MKYDWSVKLYLFKTLYQNDDTFYFMYPPVDEIFNTVDQAGETDQYRAGGNISMPNKRNRKNRGRKNRNKKSA